MRLSGRGGRFMGLVDRGCLVVVVVVVVVVVIVV